MSLHTNPASHPEDPDAWIDEQDRQRKHRQRIKRWLLLSGVFLCVPLALLTMPAYRVLKDWRATSLAREVIDQLDHLDEETGLAEPYEKAMAAYQLAPGELTAQRALARLYSIIHPASAFDLWQKVVADPSHTLKDRLYYAAAAYRLRKMDLLGQELQWFYQNHPDYVEAAVLRVKWLVAERRFEDAREHARLLASREDIDPQVRLLYVQLAYMADDAQVRAEAKSMLSEALEGYDPISLYAARLGMRLEADDRQLRDIIMLKLRSHPNATITDKLDSYLMQYERGDITLEGIYAAASEFVDLDDTEALLSYVRWLNSKGAQARTVELVDEYRALERKDLYMIYLDALAGVGDWEAVRRMLNKPEAPLQPYMKALFMVRYHYESGDLEAASESWKRVMLTCESLGDDRVKGLWWVEHYARKMRWLDYRRTVLQRLTDLPSEMRRAYESLILLEKADGNMEALLDIYRRMMKDYPDDTALLNDYAYLRLLCGREVWDALRVAQTLVKENPNYLSFRVTLALAYLQAGEAPLALQTLKETPVEWRRVPDSYQMIAALVLAAAGDKQTANEFLREVNPEKLMNEERALLNKHFTASSEK